MMLKLILLPVSRGRGLRLGDNRVGERVVRYRTRLGKGFRLGSRFGFSSGLGLSRAIQVGVRLGLGASDAKAMGQL